MDQKIDIPEHVSRALARRLGKDDNDRPLRQYKSYPLSDHPAKLFTRKKIKMTTQEPVTPAVTSKNKIKKVKPSGITRPKPVVNYQSKCVQILRLLKGIEVPEIKPKKKPAKASSSDVDHSDPEEPAK